MDGEMMKNENTVSNLTKEEYIQMIVNGLQEHCERWNYDWMEKLKEECTVKTFFKFFTKVTKTYFIKWKYAYYSVEFFKDERVIVKRCAKDFNKRGIDIELSLSEVLEAIRKGMNM